MIALLFLIGSALLGSGLVRLMTGRLLNHAEQALWGLVVGWTVGTVAAYATARTLGGLTLESIIALTALVWLAALILCFGSLKGLRHVRWNMRSLWRPGYAGLLFVLLLFAPVFFELFRTRMLQRGAGGIYSGGGSTWFDLNLHLAISTSFLYGHNYPPVYTPFPPAPLVYPFLPDFQTALLVGAGLDLHSALTVTGVTLALAIVGLFYSLAQRIGQSLLPASMRERERAQAVETEASKERGQGAGARAQWGACVATILFLLNGGLGFLYFFRDWRLSGKSFPDFWSHLKTNYAHMPAEGIQWANLISDGLLPQRPILYGIPLTLICITLFAIVWQDGPRDGRWSGWRSLLGAGLLASVLPFFHVHSYVAVGLISIALFILRPRRVWLLFFVPALMLALPRLIPLMGHVGQGFFRLQPGWRGTGGMSWPLYWFRNTGLPLLLIFPAYFTAPAEWRRFYLAFVALLLFSLLVIISPNDFDNIKLIYYWYAMTCVLIADWLVRLAVLHRQRVAAALLFIASIATGALALQYERLDRKLLFGDEELAAAAFVREHTAPRSLFLTAPAFNQPMLCLAGRAVVRANTDWLWSHGYPFQEREADVKIIYAGEAEARELLRYYGVEYVYLGPKERDDLRADEGFFEQNFPAVFRSDHITIYDTRALVQNPADAGMSARGATTAAAAAPREFASRIGKDPYQWLVEFPRAGYAVYRYYRVAFGRRPGYEEMIEDMRVTGRGVYVGAQGWEQAMENNKAALAEALAGRADFKSLYDSQTNAQYVDALYRNAGVQPSTRERSETIAALDARTQTRAAALRTVADNGQLYGKEYNAAYVLMHYFGYLRRDPEDQPDGELAGFNFWLGNLNRTGDYRSLSRAFLESGEYKDQIKEGSGKSLRP
jgi:hypothetical protein